MSSSTLMMVTIASIALFLCLTCRHFSHRFCVSILPLALQLLLPPPHTAHDLAAPAPLLLPPPAPTGPYAHHSAPPWPLPPQLLITLLPPLLLPLALPPFPLPLQPLPLPLLLLLHAEKYEESGLRLGILSGAILLMTHFPRDMISEL